MMFNDRSARNYENIFSLQIASLVPSYKERLRTVLLKSQFQERIAQIKPVIFLQI